MAHEEIAASLFSFPAAILVTQTARRLGIQAITTGESIGITCGSTAIDEFIGATGGRGGSGVFK